MAILAVLVTGSATPLELAGAYRQLLRPFAAIAGIMIMTACVQRSGLLEALAGRFLNRGNLSAGGLFTLSFFFCRSPLQRPQQRCDHPPPPPPGPNVGPRGLSRTAGSTGFMRTPCSRP